MTALLAFLLVLTVVGLAFLGFHAFQLRSEPLDLDADLLLNAPGMIKTSSNGMITRKREGSASGPRQQVQRSAKRWNEYSTALKAEVQRLSKWKNVADAEVKAAEMVRTAGRPLKRPRPMQTTTLHRGKGLAPCRQRPTRKQRPN